jgi:acetylglutamate kinase
MGCTGSAEKDYTTMNLHIIKIGGNIIDNAPALLAFTADLSGLKEPFILVHGGGKIATGISRRLGIETRMAAGRRITDQDTLDVVVMVYAGLINKQIVAQLQSNGCNAIGLCGADAGIIRANKRRHPEIDFGFVGDPVAVDAGRLQMFIQSGLTPVIAPVTHDSEGQLLNTNADTIASSVAIAMAQIYDVHLHYCFEKAGVMRDLESEDSLIPKITAHDYEELRREGVIADGMIPKLDNAFAAIRAGVKEVSILHARSLTSFISKNETAGTRIIA